ncbi:hypothetical protein [Bacillus sp. R86525]|uniref:hypothetical protein n=1 Tax=Bacillus sp. R86525 TaxID=3101709 RepID=UPI00366FCD96
MEISQNRKQMIDELTSTILNSRNNTQPYIVGISGVDTSGKSRLTDELESKLLELNYDVQVIHIDDFHNPKRIRYNTAFPEPEQYYNLSINFQELIDEILIPIKNNNELSIVLSHLDLSKDEFTKSKEYKVCKDTIVLLEGVFLYRKELSQFLDFFIYLEIDESTMLDRAKMRDVPTQGEEVIRKYDEKYIPAQKKYIHTYQPKQNANIVIDNNCISNPIIKYKPISKKEY